MFERFTDRARRVVVLAQEEARMLEGYVGEPMPGDEPGVPAGTLVPLSQEAHSVMYLAKKISRKLGKRTVDPVDILLALLGSAELDVAVMLQRLGVDLALLKQR